jgi:hypothetical protein
MTKLHAPLLIAALVACAGCRGVPITIHNAVPPDIDRSTARTVEGDAYGVQAFLLIPIGIGTRHKRAWDDLLLKAGDSYVTNVELKEAWTWALLGTIYHTTFRATAYPKRAAASR